MRRLGCISVPALPLQILLKAHPSWRPLPVAVVTHERPQGTILHVNRHAIEAGVRPGMRYAEGLSLQMKLRAGTVSHSDLESSVLTLTRCLRRFGPHVEPSQREPGVLWLDLAGLDRQWPDPEKLSVELGAAVKALEFRARVVIGFTRFATYALAQVSPAPTILAHPAQERKAALRVPLSRLLLSPATREELERLGIRTVADFLRLPADGVLLRLGAEAHALHRMAAGALTVPLQPALERVPAEETVALEEALTDVSALLFLLKGPVDRVVGTLASTGQAVAELSIALSLEGLPDAQHRIRPAAPTLDQGFLMELVRLRLDAMKLEAGIIGIKVTVRGTRTGAEQLRLFQEQTRRDLAAGNRALARIRAEFGEQAVVRPVLLEGHLPEARFAWEPMEKLVPAQPQPAPGRPPLVRRLYGKPVPIANPLRRELHGEDVQGPGIGPVVHLTGPDRIAGGWWRRDIARDYYYAHTASGDVLWVYYDVRRRAWFLHGRVE